MTHLARPTNSNMMRQKSFLFALIAASIFFSILICEVAGRLLGAGPRTVDVNIDWGATGWAREDALLGWRNGEGTFRSVEAGEALMTFWPGGRRASWHNEHKSASKRVHVYGGSFTQAYGVPDDRSFTFRLNAMFPDVRFENFGVAGYGGYQALLKMRQVMAQSDGDPNPDLLIYGFIGGHLRRNISTSLWIKRLKTSRQGFLIPPRARVAGEGLEEFPPGFIEYWPLETHSVLITLLHDAALAVKYDDWSGSGEEVSFRVITQMQELAKANRAGFLVVLLDDVPEGMPSRLERAKIPFVDCVNPALYEDSRFRTGGDSGHPSAAQHKLWSGCIGRWLSGSGLGSKTWKPETGSLDGFPAAAGGAH